MTKIFDFFIFWWHGGLRQFEPEFLASPYGGVRRTQRQMGPKGLISLGNSMTGTP
jgi:hypothetical protein